MTDFDGDKVPDIVLSNKKGTNVLLQKRAGEVNEVARTLRVTLHKVVGTLRVPATMLRGAGNLSHGRNRRRDVVVRRKGTEAEAHRPA